MNAQFTVLMHPVVTARTQVFSRDVELFTFKTVLLLQQGREPFQ
jgi:hypothetical protein